MKTCRHLLLLFTLAPVLALALDGKAILEKVDRNLEPESYEMTRKLINEEPDGKRKEYILYSVKKGRDKVAALFLAPASDKGRSTLRQGDNMWLYIPNVGKPVRIRQSQRSTAVSSAERSRLHRFGQAAGRQLPAGPQGQNRIGGL